ncbi:MAG TPA: FecR domain-containing protein [Puia sp.]|nr:FecR domain-containing protein [Puia sp.]
MPIPSDIHELIEKYLAGTADTEEVRRLQAWYDSFDDSQAEIEASPGDDAGKLRDRIRRRLQQTIAKEQNSSLLSGRRFRIRWMAAAAAALIPFIGITWYLLSSHPVAKPDASRPVSQPVAADIRPGGNKAVLTLANGQTIVLDSIVHGIIGQQGNMKIEKRQDGQVAYSADRQPPDAHDAQTFNVVTTPPGGQYQVTLSDGTRVWLNAASSIRFPVAFTGRDRYVEITGEVYFEVAKDPSATFRVRAAGAEMKVLGTSFNVNAYSDEPAVRTTLLEGKVAVSTYPASYDKPQQYLQPGQQSVIGRTGSIHIVDHADIEEVMAWRYGRFQFKSSDLQSVMRQIARWYDAEVVYTDQVNLHFTGQITRNINVSKVLEQLTLTGEIHTRIEGKKIFISH